jgi:hypothetical protein
MINHGTPGMLLFLKPAAPSTSPNVWRFIIGKFNRYLFHTVTGPSEVAVAISKLKNYKSPGSDQIAAELNEQKVKHYSLRSINS